MSQDIFQGRLVRLRAIDPHSMADAYSRWSQDTEYWRLMVEEPAYALPLKSTREWLEEESIKGNPRAMMFAIHSLKDDRLVGETWFEEDAAADGEIFFTLGIGDRESRGKGYGRDALHLILRYAFSELNLQRVSLVVIEYNQPAIELYQKAGFVEEGRLRGNEQRAGRRYDLIYMGLLREEWELSQAAQAHD